MPAYHDFLCACNYYYCNRHFVWANGVTVCTDWLGSEPAWNGCDQTLYTQHIFHFRLMQPILPTSPSLSATSHRPEYVSQDFSVSTLHLNRLIIYIILLRCCSVNDDAHGGKYVERHYILLRIDRYNIRDTDATHAHTTHVRMSAYKMNFRRDYNRIQLDVIGGKTSRKNVLLDGNNTTSSLLLLLRLIRTSITKKFVTKRVGGDGGDAAMAAADCATAKPSSSFPASDYHVIFSLAIGVGPTSISMTTSLN